MVAKKGEGTFSEVIKAQSIKTGQFVAIKCMKNQFSSIEQVRPILPYKARSINSERYKHSRNCPLMTTSSNSSKSSTMSPHKNWLLSLNSWIATSMNTSKEEKYPSNQTKSKCISTNYSKALITCTPMEYFIAISNRIINHQI